MAYKTPVKVPTLDESVTRLVGLPEGIKLIREKEGLSYGHLARSLGVSKTEVWHWEHGNRMPREPLVLLSLLSWSDRLKASA